MSHLQTNANGYLDERAKLRGKTAVVVGGGGGIGAEVSLALAGAGVNIAICDKNKEALAATLAAADIFGITVLSRQADVRSRDQLDDFFSEVARWTEEVDILVNVAGGTLQRSFLNSDCNQDDEDIRLNFGYVMDSIRHTAPKMRRGGSIINFTTIEAHRGAASFATYAGAKAATTHLSRALAVELGPTGIRVNCVAPDTTPSVGNGAALPLEKDEAIGRLPPRAAELGLEMYIPL
jgi:NAD(P)-dependent dehydrogenase (short-subunit alcohol dehydrogenase family)